MTIRTGDELRDAAATAGLDRVYVRDCGFCGYPCGYVIDGDAVFYDAGCHCTPGGPVLRVETWDGVAAAFNMNVPENNPGISAEWAAAQDERWGLVAAPPETKPPATESDPT